MLMWVLVCSISAVYGVYRPSYIPPDAFSVPNIYVNVKGKLDVARKMAIKSAKKQAFTRLIKKITGKKLSNFLYKPSYVKSYSIQSEYFLQDKTYEGLITVNFWPNAIRMMLSTQDVMGSETSVKPLIVLPVVIQENNVIDSKEKNRLFFQFWEKIFNTGNAQLTATLLPYDLISLTEKTTLEATLGMLHINNKRLIDLWEKGYSGVFVIQVMMRNGEQWRFVRGYVKMNYVASPIVVNIQNTGQSLLEAITQLSDTVQNKWRTLTQSTYNGLLLTSGLTFHWKNLKQWHACKDAIERNPLFQDVKVKWFSPTGQTRLLLGIHGTKFGFSYSINTLVKGKHPLCSTL